MSEIPCGIFGVLISFADLARFSKAVDLTELTNFFWGGLTVGLCRKLSKRAAAEVKKTQKCLLLHTHSAYDDL